MAIDPSLQNALEPEPSGLTEIARDIEQHAPVRPPLTGSDALTAVLCSISQGLDAAELRELADLLPPDFRGSLQACPVHKEGNERLTANTDLVERVAGHLGMDVGDAERTTAVVLEAILQRLPSDAAEQFARMLPPDLR